MNLHMRLAMHLMGPNERDRILGVHLMSHDEPSYEIGHVFDGS